MTRLAPLLLLCASAAAAPPEGREFIGEARLVARVGACAGDEPIPARFDRAAVDRYCVLLRRSIADYRERILDPARPFLARIVPPGLPSTVVYPFGGGDLVTALAVFPDAAEITTLSLEAAGDPRGLERLDRRGLDKLLAVSQRKIAHFFRVDHHKTTDLMLLGESELPPELLLSLIGLDVSGFEPTSLRYFSVEPSGALRYLADDELRGREGQPPHAGPFASMEIRFRRKGGGGAERVFRHIRANLDNPHLSENPGIIQYLEKRGPVAALTKAASYLLWWPAFSTLRDYLLRRMEWMISDSTGILPRDAAPRGFTQEVYGRFEAPLFRLAIDDVADMRALWQKQPARPLPFRFGYPDKKKGFHMLITRRAPREAR